MNPLQDTDTHELASAEPGVEVIGSVIETEYDLDESKKALVEDLKERARRLAGITGWEREQFLEYAGCTSAERVIAGKPSINLLLMCLSYLMWVEKIMNELDLQSDRQAAVIALDRLFRDSGEDLPSCRQAMTAKLHDDELSATELLRLGEVTSAFQVALAHTNTEPGRRMKGVLLDDPLYLGSPHVSDDRIELAWTEPDALGERIAEHIRDHVVLCGACAEAYAQRARRG